MVGIHPEIRKKIEAEVDAWFKESYGEKAGNNKMVAKDKQMPHFSIMDAFLKAPFVRELRSSELQYAKMYFKTTWLDWKQYREQQRGDDEFKFREIKEWQLANDRKGRDR